MTALSKANTVNPQHDLLISLYLNYKALPLQFEARAQYSSGSVEFRSVVTAGAVRDLRLCSENEGF